MATTTAADLLDLLGDIERAVREHPELTSMAVPAGDVFVQSGDGHIVITAADDATDQRRAWVFINMGKRLHVVTCGWRGNQLDPQRARALGAALIGWADATDAGQ